MNGIVMMPPAGVLKYDKNGEKVENITRDGLINDLTELRRANAKPIGDPARDIDQVLAGVEGYSSPIPVENTEPRPQPRPRLIDKVNSWLANQYSRRGSIKYVSAMEANRRAGICAKCPKNKEWRDSCQTCNASAKAIIARNIVILSQNKRVNAKISACSVTGQSNEVAVFLDQECLKSSLLKVEEVPKACWLRSI
jgi:hypothetical protein